MNRSVVHIDNQLALTLMRTIADEADGWDPNIRISYEPSAGIAGEPPFIVVLNVKSYRRRNRRQAFTGHTPEAALNQALTALRQANPR